MTDDRILGLALAKGSAYRHRSDPTVSSYGFTAENLLDFARAVIAEALEEAAKRCEDKFDFCGDEIVVADYLRAMKEVA